MRFSQFCDIAENTEQEQQLFQFLKEEALSPLAEHSTKLKRIPIIGKVLTAILVLAKSESIAEFRQSKHYRHLMNWDVKFDGEHNLEINPSDIQKKKVLKILAVIGVILAILVICRKCCCRKK